MNNDLRITAAQIDTTLGDIDGNANKIIKSAIYARDVQKADVIVFPEMALSGYPPEDLLFRQELHAKIKIALKKIQTQIKNIYVVLGLPTQEKNQIFNSALVLYNKKILASYHKQLLPNYGVFDEKRYFTPGTTTCVTKIKGVKTAITICEDLWFKEPLAEAKKMGAELVIGINASPFDTQKFQRRVKTLALRAKENKIPIIYVNTIGAQDELVFDGGSLVMNAQGVITQQAPFFREYLMPIDLNLPKLPLPQLNPVELVYQALVLGVKDYIEKNDFQRAIIGISGGIDSALTLAIAVDALGKDRVETIYLPSRYSSSLSQNISRKATKLLGVKYSEISIEPMLQEFLKNLKPIDPLKNLTIQNIQARCRGIILMAFANNQAGTIVLSTGNKSEMAVGYATLYGDMVGGFCVLKDVPKTLVYQLASYRNKLSRVIPEAAITRAPTAELAKNQKDADDLPPYPILDDILERYLERNQSIQKIAAAGFKKEVVTKVINMIKNSEYKRRQAPPGVKITTCAFGRERRYPITSRFDFNV